MYYKNQITVLQLFAYDSNLSNLFRFYLKTIIFFEIGFKSNINVRISFSIIFDIK